MPKEVDIYHELIYVVWAKFSVIIFLNSNTYSQWCVLFVTDLGGRVEIDENLLLKLLKIVILDSLKQ